MAKSNSKTKKQSPKQSAKMAPPPPGAHIGEHRYGLGLGLLIGALLGLFIGAAILLFFEVQRRDVLEDVNSVINKTLNSSSENRPSSMESPLPTVISNDTGGGTADSETFGDEPEISQTSPLNNARDVPADAEISISFDIDMGEDTLNKNTVTIFSTNDDEDISDQMRYTYREDSRQLTIEFEKISDDFGEENIIEVVVTSNVKSADGTPIEEPFTFSFLTE